MSASDPLRDGCDSEPAIIDEEHLGRATLGDRQLEREVLEIFVRQSAMMLARVASLDPVAAAAAAHTMSGSARSIGAWRMARAAERLERVVKGGSNKKLDDAVAALKSASLEVNAAISARLVDPARHASDRT
jgi:HPt (histidine-containing phosphotransfer) domain-containing protein